MEKPLENCNTATPQQREQNDARIGSAERQRGSTSVNAQQSEQHFRGGRKKVGQKFVDRNERFVPLPRR